MNLFVKQLIQSKGSTLPIITHEQGALEILSEFTQHPYMSFDAYKEDPHPTIFLCEKKTEKKHLSISDIREWILEMNKKPYEGKMLIILKDFDEATVEAMNASLKMLEEPPEYAIIILTVKNPELLLDTIRSRSLIFFTHSPISSLDENVEGYIREYYAGNPGKLLNFVLKEKIETGIAIKILICMAHHAHYGQIKKIELAIENLTQTYESPKSILDKVLIYG